MRSFSDTNPLAYAITPSQVGGAASGIATAMDIVPKYYQSLQNMRIAKGMATAHLQAAQATAVNQQNIAKASKYLTPTAYQKLLSATANAAQQQNIALHTNAAQNAIVSYKQNQAAAQGQIAKQQAIRTALTAQQIKAQTAGSLAPLIGIAATNPGAAALAGMPAVKNAVGEVAGLTQGYSPNNTYVPTAPTSTNPNSSVGAQKLDFSRYKFGFSKTIKGVTYKWDGKGWLPESTFNKQYKF